MGHKTSPIGLRLQINRTWDSRWFADGDDYGRLLLEDLKIRNFVMKTLPQAAISKVVIERPAKLCRVSVYAARPGVIIGKKGADIDKLRRQLAAMTSSEVSLNIVEIRKPEVDAKLVAQSVADQLVRRVAFRRAMKRAVQSALRLGAEGIRVLAGQDATIDIADDLAGDDVDAVAAVDDRRDGGVAGGCAKRELLVIAERQAVEILPGRVGEDLVDRAAGFAEGVPEGAQHGLDRRCHDGRELVLGERDQRAAHPQHGGVVARHRRVARLGAGDDRHPRATLLTRLAEVEALAGDVDGVAAALVDRDLGVDQVAVVLPHPGRAVAAAGLLVGEGAHDQVAVERQAHPLDQQHDQQFGGDEVLGIDRAATPDHAVGDIGRERRVLPLVGFDRDDVAVGHQHERAALALALDPGNEAGASRRALQNVRREADRRDDVTQVRRDLRLVAGRVDRLEPDQILEMSCDLVAHAVPVDLGPDSC